MTITMSATPTTISYEAVLRTLNLDPSKPETQALLLVCERYGLDPVMKHITLISGNPYITRDGYLAVAHQSGQFDGVEVVDQGETNSHFTAKVSVYRKDMTRPFTYAGRYPKDGQMAKKYGPEMAVKVAEVQALRRAFNVTGISAADEMWEEDLPSFTSRADAATGEIVEATAVEAAPAPGVDPRFAGLKEILDGIEPEDERKRCSAALRATFGPPADMTDDEILEACKIAAGWPASAPGDGEAPF